MIHIFDKNVSNIYQSKSGYKPFSSTEEFIRNTWTISVNIEPTFTMVMLQFSGLYYLATVK